MNGASLLLVAFKWTLLGRVAGLGPLVNGASPVGGEEARGDSPSSPPSLLRLRVGKGREESQTFLSADRFNPPLHSSVLVSWNQVQLHIPKKH